MKNKKVVVTITDGASQSGVIDKSHFKNMLIIMPAAWDAANITFLVSDNPTTGFVMLVDDAGAEVALTTVTVSTAISLTGVDKESLESAMFVKIRSGTNATPVNQTPGREFTVILSG